MTAHRRARHSAWMTWVEPFALFAVIIAALAIIAIEWPR